MDELIGKYLTGELSQEELLKLEAWVKESEENRTIFSQAVNIYALSSQHEFKNDKSDLSGIVSALKRKGFRRKILRFSAVAAFAASLILLVSQYYDYKITSYQNEVNYILSQSETKLEYFTPYGVKSKINLPDNSIVWLNSGSRISFPSKFAGDSREISFSGEGYFDVTKDSVRPMNIKTPSGYNVLVLGTRFNLSAYKEDKNMSILLFSGVVKLNNQSGKTIATMEPSEKLVIDFKTKNTTSINPKDSLPIVGWKEGWLIFDDTPLVEVFKKMKRWYGIEVKVQDKSVYSNTFTAKFKEESASQVFDLMKKISLLNYSITDSIAFVSPFK